MVKQLEPTSHLRTETFPCEQAGQAQESKFQQDGHLSRWHSIVSFGHMKIKFILLVTAFAAVTTVCTAQSTKKEKPVSINVLVDSLSRKLEHFYIFPEKSLAMTTFLKQQLKRGAYSKITDKTELARKLHDDIQSVHRDGHLRVSYDPGFANELLKPPSAGPRMADSSVVLNARRENFGFTRAEILNGNIGYVKFTQFSGFVNESMPTLTASFGFVSNTKAIILDLRENGGGSPWMVARIASFFAQEKTRLNDIYERERDTTVAFYAEPALAGNMKLSQPLYILTSKRTFSAAEDFTYAMQVNKRATIVGDTTGGGAHPTRAFPIGQGFVVGIPFARSINYITKTDWEGTGVHPDIATSADEALRKAQLHYFETLLPTAAEGDPRRSITWAINYLKVHPYDSSFDNARLNAYCGKFKDFEFSVKDNKLYCVSRFDGKFYLTPIEDDLFLVRDDLQLQFIRDSDNKIAKLRLIGKIGWEEFFEREK